MLKFEDFKRAIQDIDALGANPAILAKVAEMAKDPDTDLMTVCALLRNDGPLVADIIRISNSLYYAPSTSHGNLDSAVSQIGLREAFRVVNLSISRQLFARDLPGYGVSAHDYWSDSIASALVMEALAKETGLNPEDAFTVGILHAIGRVLINRVINEKGYSVFWDGQQPIEEWERGSVGFDYAQAGALLLEHWRFPKGMCNIIRRQLKAEEEVEPVSLLGSLSFSMRLLAATGLDFEMKNWRASESDPFVRQAGLTNEVISQILWGCKVEFQRILRSVEVR